MSGRERLQEYLKIPPVNRIYTRAEKAFREKKLIGHGWDHVLRDIVNAIVVKILNRQLPYVGRLETYVGFPVESLTY